LEQFEKSWKPILPFGATKPEKIWELEQVIMFMIQIEEANRQETIRNFTISDFNKWYPHKDRNKYKVVHCISEFKTSV
jgi:hypothetical protein